MAKKIEIIARATREVLNHNRHDIVQEEIKRTIEHNYERTGVYKKIKEEVDEFFFECGDVLFTHTYELVPYFKAKDQYDSLLNKLNSDLEKATLAESPHVDFINKKIKKLKINIAQSIVDLFDLGLDIDLEVLTKKE